MFNVKEKVEPIYEHRLFLSKQLELVEPGSLDYVKYLKEFDEIGKICALYDEYLSLEYELEETLPLCDDPEYHMMADGDCEEIRYHMNDLEEKMKELLLTSDPNDSKNCTLEIRAGVGGDEAAIFANELLQMYLSFCNKKHLNTTVVSEISGAYGISKAIVQVKGKDAYKYLKFESGGHRVQRVPDTESKGRLHTSMATVAVIPEVEKVEVKIDEKDVRVDLFHSGGKGGQNVNKVETAIRLTHTPTGIVVQCQDERSQYMNRTKAWARLQEKLEELERTRSSSLLADKRKTLVGSGDRSERIRTYNFPQDRITDHRIGFSTFGIYKVLSGNLDEIHEALALEERKLNLE